MANNEATSLLKVSDLMTRLSLSRSGVYRLIRSGDLPAPIYLTANSPRWPETAILGWLQSKVVESERRPG